MSVTVPQNIAPYIDAAGIHIPLFSDVLNYFIAQFQSIYGADAYIANDSQDGQWIGIIAQAYYNNCTFAAAVFNAQNPNNAQGAGLSSIVKLNGLTRLVPTNSEVTLTLTGNVGTTITNGYVLDNLNNQWNLPAIVQFGNQTTVSVTATANASGSISAAANAVTKIGNPQLGWSAATNPQAATVGAPAETDATLRSRQQISTAIASETIADGIAGSIAQLPGVTRVVYDENVTSTTDAYSVPGHSIAFVVDGGQTASIAQVIANQKSLGCGTYGNTQVTVTNAYGNPQVVNFSRSTQVHIIGQFTVKALTNYTSSITTQIIAAVVAYINSIPIGGDISVSRIYMPANLNGGTNSNLFEIDVNTIQIGIYGGSTSAANIQLSFGQEAYTTTADWNITVGTT